MIQAQNISKTYFDSNNATTVFENISLTVNKKKILLITGVSGSGKSTLLNLLAGLDNPTSGIIFYNGENIHTMPPEKYKLYKKAISFVFQFPHLIAELSVLENTMISAQAIGISVANAKKNALELLGQVGLYNLANRWPHELSGGQKQRIALARALCSKPQFLFADEPTGSLDSQTGADIYRLLRVCADNFGIGIVLTSHDPQSQKYADSTLQINSQDHSITAK